MFTNLCIYIYIYTVDIGMQHMFQTTNHYNMSYVVLNGIIHVLNGDLLSRSYLTTFDGFNNFLSPKIPSFLNGDFVIA